MLKEGKFWWFATRLEDELKALEREAAKEEKELEKEREYWKNKALYEEGEN